MGLCASSSPALPLCLSLLFPTQSTLYEQRIQKNKVRLHSCGLCGFVRLDLHIKCFCFFPGRFKRRDPPRVALNLIVCDSASSLWGPPIARRRMRRLWDVSGCTGAFATPVTVPRQSRRAQHTFTNKKGIIHFEDMGWGDVLLI